MRDSKIADVVHGVLSYGLRLRQQLEQGEKPGLEAEQAVLKGLLKSDNEARRWRDYGHEVDPTRSVTGTQARGGDGFLGIRYGLVCWLDEIFTNSPWGDQWQNHILEQSLYGHRVRAENFWEQAKQAERRSGSDALEAFYLCAMLGFRGVLRDKPDRLKGWRKSCEAQIEEAQPAKWLDRPQELQPPTNVPPLRGRERLRKVQLLLIGALLVLVPVVTFLLVSRT
jgi:type VI secretion system protein ImpK